MTVTFQLYRVVSDGTESSVESLTALSVEKLARSSTGKKTAQPVMFETEVWIPQGHEGPQIKISGYTTGSSWLDVLFGDLVKVTSSTYTEFPANTYWWVDNITMNRESSYGTLWKYDLTLIRSWRTIKGVLRS